MAQTWTDVLRYIKINMGVPLNQLELSDDDIVDNLRDQVLPVFSQYSPTKKFKSISTLDLFETVSGEPMYQYQIPLTEEEYIIDVVNIYHTENISMIDSFTSLISNPMQAIDVAIWNSYTDIVKSLQKKNTWEFIPPNRIIFDDPVRFAILECQVVHDNLNTIEPDKYHLMFKKLCLANVKIWISAMRSKYENLTTPFGPINLNWEKLQQEGNQEKEEVMQLLTMLPPDILVHIDV